VQIKGANEGIQKAHGVFGSDVILQPFRKHQGLVPIQSGAMIHACIRHPSGVKVSKI
jgi:hypothetical protein